MLLGFTLALSCLSCTDRSPTLPVPRPGQPELVATIACRVDVQTLIVTCTDAHPDVEGPSLALMGSTQIRTSSSNVVSDTAAQRFSMDVTAENLLTYSIGTPDDSTTTGFKVFFESGPTVSAYYAPGDTGTVTVRNPDGFQNITAAQQPYHLYDTILPPAGISAPKRWEFNVPRTVKTFSYTVRVFTATARELRVPIVAPNRTPSWFNNPQNWLRYGNSMTMIVMNVVMVDFQPGATQEERQSAVDMVKGSVAGGGGGVYYIRVPTSGNVRSLENQVAALQRLPQVKFADVYVTTGDFVVNYLKPYDTIGWRDWELNPDSASQQNWALERIAAPLAWGCSYGDAVINVAVLDVGFHDQPDLARNLDLPRSRGWNLYAGAADTLDHGTRVAAIMTARGNDSSQVTGTMWRSSLRVHDISTDTAGIAQNGRISSQRLWSLLRTASRDGARVINISAALQWVDSTGAFRNPETEADPQQRLTDKARLNRYERWFNVALDSIVGAGNDPLIVVAAGNNAIDARWSGWATAKYPSRVVMVGASTRTDSLAWFSNRGGLVEVAAPGQDLVTVWGNGSIASTRTWPSGWVERVDGTSFAAPHVSGVAGLLFSFDPRLTAADAKQLILNGARRGNRIAGGIPILNARESLVLAGQRPGAPLCGNRTWIQNGKLYAQRDSSYPGEELFPVPAPSPARRVTFNALHGGKRIMLHTRPDPTAREWSPTGWNLVPYVADAPGANASYLSQLGMSHNQDTIISIEMTQTSARTMEFRPELEAPTLAAPVLFPTAVVDSVFEDARLCTAVFQGVTPASHQQNTTGSAQQQAAYAKWLADHPAGSCRMLGPPSAMANARRTQAYAPVGQEAIFFVIRTRGAATLTSQAACVQREGLTNDSGQPVGTVTYNATCLNASEVIRSTGTSAYRIHIPTRDVQLMAWGDSVAELWFPMISEDGKEMFVERQTVRDEATYTWVKDSNGHSQTMLRTQLPSTPNCSLQLRDRATGVVRQETHACGLNTSQGGFSPERRRTSRP